MKKKTQLLSLLLVLTMLLAFVPASAQAVDETPYDLRVLTLRTRIIRVAQTLPAAATGLR